MADNRKIIDRIIDGQTDKIVRAVTLTMWTQLVKYTPADTGRARAGWFVTKNNPTTQKPSEGEYSNKAKAPLRRVGVKAPTAIKPGRVGDYWIVNNVEYIAILDQGRSVRDGQMRGSEQAPRGMTSLALNDLRRAFRIR